MELCEDPTTSSDVPGKSRRVFLGLGANLGPRRETLAAALRRLEQGGIRVVRVSSVYETEPVELLDQPDFLNQVCEVRTDLSPGDLLRRVKEIEQDLGRVPGIPKGPRLIDIDILLYGDLQLQSDPLTIPHPALRFRRFVLLPLSEIAPDLPDPVSGSTIRRLLSDCPDRSHVEFRHPPSPPSDSSR